MSERSPASIHCFSVSLKHDICSLSIPQTYWKEELRAFKEEKKMPYPRYPRCGPIALSMPQLTF